MSTGYPMSLSRRLAALLLAPLAGCFTDAVPADVQIECRSNAECPSGHICRDVIQRCVRDDAVDQTAPALAGAPRLSPEVARAGAALAVEFSVSEKLSADPRVRLGERELALDEEGTDRAALAYRYLHKVVGTEPEGAPVPVTVDLVDASGNVATGLSGGAARFDFTPPGLVSSTLSAKRASRGTPLQVSFVYSEALSGEPVVSMTRAGEPGELLWTRAETEPGLVYRYVPDGSEAPGDWVVSVRAVDLAGNPSRPEELGEVAVDFTPPEVQRVTVTPPQAREGRTVIVEIVASEKVRPGASLVAEPQDGVGESVAFAESGSGTILAFQHTVLAGEQGHYRLTLSGLADEAGNPAPEQEVGEVVFDARAPQIIGLSTDTDRYSARPGHDVVTLTFDLDEALGPDAVAATLVGVPGRPETWHPMTCGAPQSTTPHVTCVLQVEDGPGEEGNRRIAVTARDAAGNVGDGSVNVELDFTGPSVVPETLSVQYVPDVGNVLTTVGAATAGTTVRATFVLSEPAAGTPTVRSSAPEEVDFTQKSAAGGLYVFEATLQGLAHAQGGYTLEIAATDGVGNPGSSSFADRFVVDTVAPAAPAVGTPGRIVYHRVPWGAQATGGAARYTVEGLAGAAEPGVQVRVLDGSDPELARELGRTVAGADGAFSATLARSAHPVVWLAAVDGAGNQSPAVDVKEVVWTASLRGKVAGSVFANPHLYEARPWFSRRYLQADAFEPQEVAALGDADGTALTTTGAGDWKARALGQSRGRTRFASMAYDSGRGKLVLFGGAHSTTSAETWEWDGEWVRRLPLDPEGDGDPTPRAFASAAYDSERGRVVLFGGCDDLNCLLGARGDTWEWDGASWALRAPGDLSGVHSPSPRPFSALAYDPVRKRTVLFGGGWTGENGTGEDAQTWEWDGQRWERKTPAASPAARSGHALAYDAIRNRIVLFGGGLTYLGTGCPDPLGCPTAPRNDVWEWDGSAWTERVLPPGADGLPAARLLHRLEWDGAAGALLLFGGFLGENSDDRDLVAADSWSLDGQGWSRRVPTGAPGPSARAGHAMAVDSGRGVAVVFGGQDEDEKVVEDTWELEGSAWRAQPGAGVLPSPRIGQAMTYDAARGRTVLFAGTSVSEDLNGETWEWDGTRWELRAGTDPTGAVRPSARSTSTLAWDPALGRSVLFGGCAHAYCVLGRLSDTWEWDGTSWAKLSTGSPPARGFHAMATDPGGGTLIYGGLSSALPVVQLLDDVWTRSGAAWTLGAATPGRPRRWRTAVSWDGQGMLVFGGEDEQRKTQDGTWRWTPTGWTQLTPTDPEGDGNPAGRNAHTLSWDPVRGRVLLYGGQTASGELAPDLWEWNGSSWARLATADPDQDGEPAPRGLHGVAFDERRRRLVVFGGLQSVGATQDTWEWTSGPAARPGQVARFAFAAAEAEAEATVESVSARCIAGARGEEGGSAKQGAVAWIWDRGSFIEQNTNAAAPAAPASLSWSTTDPAQIARLFNGVRKEIAVAVTPQGTNGKSAAEVAVDYLELEVRYRRP